MQVVIRVTERFIWGYKRELMFPNKSFL